MPPGPVPKKDAERRRQNKPVVQTEVVNVDELLVGEVEIPEPDENWHPIAHQLYEAQKRSGQVVWMEPSDWAMLYMLCESISRDMKPRVIGITEDGEIKKAIVPLKGASISGYLKAFEQLLVAEGSRRRMRIELERQKRLDAIASGDDVVVDIVERRADLFRKVDSQHG